MSTESRLKPRAGVFVALFMATIMLSTCFASVTSAASPVRIEGYVRNADGAAISGATITDTTTGATTTSASNGYYSISIENGGTHIIKASKEWYYTNTTTVVVSDTTGIGTGFLQLVEVNSWVQFSKSNYPDDPNIRLWMVNNVGSLSWYLYRPDGSLAESEVDVTDSFFDYFDYWLDNEPAGIWKLVFSLNGVIIDTTYATVGMAVISYNGNYGDSFSNFKIGMSSRTALGSDRSGVTTSVGAEIYSYTDSGGLDSRTININVGTVYKDNSVAPGDTVKAVIVMVEKVR